LDFSVNLSNYFNSDSSPITLQSVGSRVRKYRQIGIAFILKPSNGSGYLLVGRTRLAVETEKTQSQNNAQKTRRIPTCPFHAGSCVGRFLPFAITHKRTLPKNANPMKNTAKPNLFSCQRDHQGLHIRDEYPNLPSARLALNRSGKDDFKFSLAANP
jgi:hypothetical protein